MKKRILFSLVLASLVGITKAQTTVYSENFTSGGTGWNLNVNTGTNGSTPNQWEVNDFEGGVTPPGCGVASNGNNTLHITCTSLFCGSLITGAVYNASQTSNKRVESPIINTTGYSTLTLKFNFISLGDGVLDNASVWYNDGSGWQQLSASIKSSICGTGQGQWTAYSAALPSSCNNNANLKIAFNWTNNSDNIGTDPSVAIDDLIITAPSPLSALATKTDVLCNGLCTGSATVTPSGGTGPYTYSWTPTGGSSATASSLCTGNYVCTVTDGASATTTVSVNIAEPTALLASTSLTNVTCNGGNNGSASVNVSGGTPIYTYSWSPSGGTGSSASSLSANTYTCTITDANLCTLVKLFDITQGPPITGSQTLSICAGQSVTVGTSTYTASGIYTNTLTAMNGCDSVLTTDLTVNNPSSSNLNETSCGSYTLNSQTYTSSGTYVQTLTNALGCDSVITLILTINSFPDVTTSVVAETITANESGASYQWIDCNNSFAPLVGETGQSFTAINNGNYAVIVNNGLCTDTSACVLINSVGLNALQDLSNEIKIYPNPNDGNFVLNAPVASVIKIYNALGEIVYSVKTASDNLFIELKNLSAGVYTIHVTNNDKTGFVKFMKK